MSNRICPVWVGYLLACPLRKMIENPQKILGSFMTNGDHALDVGCAMGFYSLPLARLVGSRGKVFCVDVQKKMLASLRKRASRSGLLDRIETRLCRSNNLELDDLGGTVNFALAAAVVHEVPDSEMFFANIWECLKENGKLLVIEPKGHVSQRDFEQSIALAQNKGFQRMEGPTIKRNHTALLVK